MPDQIQRRALLGGRVHDDAEPHRKLAVIGAACLAFHGVACMSCRDACEASAIRFVLAGGGAQPRVEAEACTGCADCAPVCPASAIGFAEGGAHA